MRPGPKFDDVPCSECGAERRPGQGALGLCKRCYQKLRRKRQGHCAYCGTALTDDEPHNGKRHDQCRQVIKDSYKRQRKRVIDAYGGRCECCGEDEYVFLTIDHANDDGREHRAQVKGQAAVYRDLERRGFPDGYVVRCFNCNLGRAVNGGVCPHMKGSR